MHVKYSEDDFESQINETFEKHTVIGGGVQSRCSSWLEI